MVLGGNVATLRMQRVIQVVSNREQSSYKKNHHFETLIFQY